jgi:zinc/manganese transport system substrate-binding protein
MKRLLIALFLLFSLPAHAEGLNIVASFSILGDLVKQVGGDKVSVTTLVGPDGDAHVYQPTPKDAKAMKEARLVFVNGLGFEGWMDRLVQSSGTKAGIVTLSQDFQDTLSLEEDGKKETDPHAWQDLKNGRLYIHNISVALVQADPANATLYMENARRISDDLRKLEEWVKTQIAGVPAMKRTVITSHDAFGYFARAYGVKFMAPVGVSTEAQPSAKEMAALTDQIRNGSVRALFLENMADPKLMKQLAQETGAVVGGELYADALSAPAGEAATYQDMFRHNVTTLVKAMQANK